jgi:MoxR-like ATPase
MGAEHPPASASSPGPTPSAGPSGEDTERARVRAGAILREVIAQLSARYPERETLLGQCELALIAREHLLVFGPPGTGKTEIVSQLVRRVVDDSARPSFFSRQIVETTVQSDLVGPIDFKILTETGKSVHRIEEGILSTEFAILDEAFDGRDLLLRSILSVLNEREMALGTQSVKARLASAFLTTNRYLFELLSARPETLLAFCDRIAFCSFVPKDFAMPESRAAMLENVAGRPRSSAEARLRFADLALLQASAREVEVPEQTLAGLASLVDEFERLRAEAHAERKGYAATTYFSPRTLAKAVAVLRAAVVRDRYLRGIHRPLQATLNDLPSLEPMFVPGGPTDELLARLINRTRDKRERVQLEALKAESQAFREACPRVTDDLQRAAMAEAESVGLPLLERMAREGSSRAIELSLAAEEALGRARSSEARAKISRLSLGAAVAYAEALQRGQLLDPPSSDRARVVAAYRAMARTLAGAPERAELAARLSSAGLSAARTALAAIVSAYTVKEFEDNVEATAADVDERVQEVEQDVSRLLDAGRDLAATSGDRTEAIAELENLGRAAQRAAAGTLRRRASRTAMRSLGRAPEIDAWRSLTEVSKALARVDQTLMRLAPEEATARATALTAKCADLVAAEVSSWEAKRLEELAAIIDRAADRMHRLGADAKAVFVKEWPRIEKKLERWTTNRPLAARPDPDDYSESGYLKLLSRSHGAQDRRTLARLTTALGNLPFLAKVDAHLAQVDLNELREQVAFLNRWFDQIVASVPTPRDIASADEADGAWRLVNSSRFYTVGSRDNDFGALRERLASYRSFPELASTAEAAAKEVDGLAERARGFAQALLERRAELAA